MTQDPHNLDELTQSSWQKAPHFWQMTIAFIEHEQPFPESSDPPPPTTATPTAPELALIPFDAFPYAC